MWDTETDYTKCAKSRTIRQRPSTQAITASADDGGIRIGAGVTLQAWTALQRAQRHA